MSFSGSLKKLEITAYSDPEFKKEVSGRGIVNPFSAYINPEKYSQDFKICYNDRQAQGSSGGSPDFNKIPSDSVDFELVFDGTGVVPSPIPGMVPFAEDGIATQIDQFKNLIFTYNGNIHSPNYLKLAWGKLLFKCRLSTLKITYTLFKPDGTPLRARATAKFVGFNDEKELAAKANKTSPDLSHELTVKGGDTLPLMCYGVYGVSDYYLQVAEVNGLTDFRRLKVGAQLTFPPLGEASS